MNENVKDTVSTSVLRMVFVVSGGNTKTYNLADPKANLTKLQVQTVMNEMIEDEAIFYNGNEATDIKDAYIYTTNKIALE